MKFDPNINWPSIATFAAVVSSWLIPWAVGCAKKRRRQTLAEKGMCLYLDTLLIKLKVAKNEYFQPGGRVPTGKNAFEAVNRNNFDAIEQIYRTETFALDAKKALFDLMTYFKICPEMLIEDDFDKMANMFAGESLRVHFPADPEIDKKIADAIDSHRRNRREKSEDKRPARRKKRQ
jgi:hypothetical protein